MPDIDVKPETPEEQSQVIEKVEESKLPDEPGYNSAKDEALPDEKAPEKTDAEPEKSEDDEAIESKEKPKDGDELPRKKSRAAERIAQLTAQRRVQEARAVAAERKAQSLVEQLNKQTVIDPDDFEAQETQRLRRVLNENRLQDVSDDLHNATHEKTQLRQDAFVARCDELKEVAPDILSNFLKVPVTEFAADMIADSDVGPQIAHYLGSNPNDARHLAAMPIQNQARTIATLEARLAAAPKARKVSQAPPPPKSLPGKSAPGRKDPAEMSNEEYRKWRQAG